MSCSLKSSRDMLQEFGIISKFDEVLNLDSLQTFEENLFNSIGEDVVFNNAMGNPFFLEHLQDKVKVSFNRDFFNILDNINNERIFSRREDYSPEVVSEEELTEVDPEDVLQLKKIASRENYDDEFRRWYEKNVIPTTRDDKSIDVLDESRNIPQGRNQALEKSIKKMNEAFNVSVVLDRSIPLLGELLPVNHPLSLEMRKPVILINPDLASSETVFHEFGHLYIDLLGGSKNDLVSKAYNLLAGTELFQNTAALYPELSGEMLNREVLAQAMGIEANEIFGREIENISAFNKIINKIFEFMENLLGINRNAVSDLARELVTNKLQTTNIEDYNTTISQKQKLSVGDINHGNVTRFVETILMKNRVVNENSDRRYEIGQSGDNKVVRESTTEFVKRKIHVTDSRFSSRKGDIEKEFDRDRYTKDNIFMLLSEYKIPQALDSALNRFFKEKRLIKPTENISWDMVIANENFFSRNKRLEQARAEREGIAYASLFDEEDQPNEDESPASQVILDNFNKIMDYAQSNQREYNKGAVAGTILHDNVEMFADTEEISDDIVEGDTAFFDYMENLLTKGRAAGSKFYTEVSIFDELNNLPGTIDLLEIKANGKFVIHDYKTVKSFLSKYGNKDALTDEQLFLNKGYVAQLMIYGKILENYGMEAEDIPFNLIATQVSYGDIDGVNDRRITVRGIRTFSFNKSERGQRGIKSKLFQTDQKIERALRGRQAELTSDKKEDYGYNDLVSKIKQDIKIYNRLSIKNKKNLNDSNLKNIATKFESIEENKKLADKIKTRMSVDAIIDGVAEQLKVLETSVYEHRSSDFDKDYMYSFKYIIQALDNLNILKSSVEADKENSIGFANRQSKLDDINALIGNIESSKEYYKEQVFNHAAYELANNSNFQKGLYTERFELRLKKAGITDKLERQRQIETLLKENRYEIFDNEFKYWKQQLSDGILDLRAWEYYMADPGISKSQFVQVTKNLIDKSSIDKRLEIDAIMPEIAKWNAGISYNKTGSTKEIWGDFLEKRSVRNLDGTLVQDLNGSVIPEFTSDYREQMFNFMTQKEHYLDLLRELRNKKNKTAQDNFNIQKIKDQIGELYKENKKTIDRYADDSSYRTLRLNPDFAKLSEEKQSDLRFIHKNLRDADARVDNSKLKLTNFFKNENADDEDVSIGKGEYIYNLPRQRMNHIEAANSLSTTVGNAYSKLQDIIRKPFDIEEAAYEDENEAADKEDDNSGFNGALSDIENNEVYDVPVYFRNSLGKDRAIQSFDIPSLLAENHGTTIAYRENKMIEADLFMISEALRISDNQLKTDDIFSGKVLGAYGRPRKSDQKYVYKAVKNQIDNRIYGRHYSGVYNKGSYTVAHSVATLKNITSISTLAGNFMSALNTAGSGSVYRFLEGEVGEHFNRTDWRNGTKKTYADMANILSDTQKAFPTSKTILLIRMLGMDHQYKALANKFVQKNAISKNLDQATLFAITSLAETNITAHLMYSLTGGIKMMNKKGEYIDKEGNVVTDKKDAMTFDEAYEVENGVLKLNPHVGYTSKDFVTKFSEGGEINRIALTNISGYVKSVYADLFGQYDHDMKSVIETNVFGAAAMSMKKWLPRGLHRRFRGISSQMAWGQNLMNFEQIREDGNQHNRFYSQDQGIFQEGYFTTAARYVRLLGYELRKNGFKMNLIEKNKEIRDTMTAHEIANLGRAAKDSLYMIAMFAAKTLLLALAESIGTDPRDRIKKERAYFAAYLALKLYHESNSFVNPFSLAKTVTDPAVPSGQLFKMADLADQLFLFEYDKNSDYYFSPNAFQTFESGRKEGKSKAIDKIKSTAIPGYRNFSMATGILGLDSDPDFLISDSFKFYVRNNK